MSIHCFKLVYRLIVHTHTWHRDSHGLFDYESKNVTQNYIKCNYSSNQALSLTNLLSTAVLRRLDNDIIYEELNKWAGVEQFSECVIGNMAAVVLEKQGRLTHIYYCINLEGQYWLYHKL